MHPNPASPDRQERRKAGRIRCSQTSCQLGQIGDLSRDGCRLVAKKPLTLPTGSSVNLRLEVGGVSLVAPAKPVSCRKRSDGKYDIGFQFLGLSEEAKRDLTALARSASLTDAHVHRVAA